MEHTQENDEYIMTEAEAKAFKDTSNKNLPKIPIRQLPERKKMKVIAKVRKVGAIGRFYPQEFEADSKDDWFEKYSEKWELHHFCTDFYTLVPQDTLTNKTNGV